MAKPSNRLENLFGALALGVADRVRSTIQSEFALGGEAAAALIVIGHHAGLSVNQLSSILGLSQPGTVRLVDRLTATGLAVREVTKEDKRVIALQLTDAGTTKRTLLLRRRREAVAELLSSLSTEDHNAIEKIADTILSALPDDIVQATRVCRFCDDEQCTMCPMDAFGKLF